MMKAYVILAHRQPAQLYRLVQALNDDHSFFFIHIDQSSDITQFDGLKQWSEKVQWVSRVKTPWAGFGIVQAILNGLQAVRASALPFRHVMLLSGQDYPIKSNAFISRFTEAHANQVFLEHHHLPAPYKWQPNGGLYRVNKYYLGLKTHQRLLGKALNGMALFLFFLRRRLYADMEPYAGSMWWILNRQAVDYILDFVKEHPGYTAFHRYTFAADEVFFHTILLNTTDKQLAGNIVNNDKRFIKWKDIHAAHPETIGKEHLPDLTGSDALFARKFDAERDAAILDLIDNYRLSND